MQKLSTSANHKQSITDAQIPKINPNNQQTIANGQILNTLNKQMDIEDAYLLLGKSPFESSKKTKIQENFSVEKPFKIVKNYRQMKIEEKIVSNPVQINQFQKNIGINSTKMSLEKQSQLIRLFGESFFRYQRSYLSEGVDKNTLLNCAFALSRVPQEHQLIYCIDQCKDKQFRRIFTIFTQKIAQCYLQDLSQQDQELYKLEIYYLEVQSRGPIKNKYLKKIKE